MAVSSYAYPSNFLMLQLRKAGIEPAAEALYRDHHAYTEKDIRELKALKDRSEAGGFVTTEKDAINLGGFFSALEPIAVIPVAMRSAHRTCPVCNVFILRTRQACRR